MSIENALDRLFGRIGTKIDLLDSLKAASSIAESLRGYGVPDTAANVLVLDGAEFSLVTGLATTGPREVAPGELSVTLNEFYTALEKLRCPWLECCIRLATAPTVADVIPFPGDLKKTGLDPNSQPNPNIFVSGAPVAAVRASYMQAEPVARYAGVRLSPTLFLQGGIWALRAQVLRYPREFQSESSDLGPLVSEYIEHGSWAFG